MVDLSVVIPVFQSRESLKELCLRLNAAVSQISSNYEIVLVNDASPDQSWQLIQEIAATDDRVRGINLSRNFGQHFAITAGLDQARGTWIVVMDCDLQDSPEEIPRLYEKTKEGYDVVVGRRANRQDAFFKKLSSRIFYRVFTYFTGSNIDNRISNFGIYNRKVIRSINSLKEQNRSFGLFAWWVGFRRAEIDVVHASRSYGKSSYTLRRRIKLAVDSIVAHSNKLLRISVKLGLLLSLSSLFYALWLVIRYFFFGIPAAGWTSLIVSIYFTSGLIMGSVGVMGLYIGKIFDEVKGRPLYIIDSTTFELEPGHD